MPDVNVTELRQNLPAYLAKVRAGQHLRITSRGKVIAELSPPGMDLEPAEIARAMLRGSVVRYEQPLEPTFAEPDWDANR
jgi:antitoxin (DNA-binding transcriptional repressor) of toxin-antitoxin stability system